MQSGINSSLPVSLVAFKTMCIPYPIELSWFVAEFMHGTYSPAQIECVWKLR